VPGLKIGSPVEENLSRAFLVWKEVSWRRPKA